MIQLSQSTHASRKSGVNIMSLAGVSDEQQSIAKRWIASRKTGHYNSSLPHEALKALADFDPVDRNDYFLPRAEVIPCKELQFMVFPEIEYWLGRYQRKEIDEEQTGPKFLQLLQHLRIIFLQVE